MSVSRCLGPALNALNGRPRDQWRPYIDALPRACPHGDCGAKAGCRKLVADYFRVQWHVQANRELVVQRKAGVIRG